MKLTNTIKRQVAEMINRDETIVNIINYLFTCDYCPLEVVDFLVNDFKCNRRLVGDVMYVDFGMDMYI